MLKGLKLKPKTDESAPSSNEQPQQQQQPAVQRDSWMVAPPEGASIFEAASSSSRGKNEANDGGSQPQKRDGPVELNPYFRDGGSGLPAEQASKKLETVGDGGADWRARAMRRARERASQDDSKEPPSFIKQHQRQQQRSEEKPRQQQAEPRRDTQRSSDDSGHSRDRYLAFHKSSMKRPSEEDYHRQPVATASSSAAPAAAAVTQPPMLSGEALDEQLNKLSAKAMKAQMMGNDDLYRSLQKEIDALKTKKPASVLPAVSSEENVIILPEFDLKGRKIVSSSSLPAGDGHDDSIQSMLREELQARGSSSLLSRRDLAAAADASGAGSKYSRKRGKFDTADDEYDVASAPGGIEAFETSSSKKPAKKPRREEEASAAIHLQQQIREFKAQSSAFDECPFCFANKSKKFKKQSMISLGDKFILMLSPFGSLVEGACVLAPLEHRLAAAYLDEDEQQELQRFKQCLRKMFISKGKDVIFIETVTQYNMRKNKHCFIEVLPVPMQVGQEAPGYFKKAILESDSEWSQNKKLIETQGRPVQRCVPKGFPYFHVEFGLSGSGFAHVIEDEQRFSFTFGREIVAGMLKLPQNTLKSLSKGTTPDKEHQEVRRFLEVWTPFDWTQQLE